jgi:hypothetical protein
MNLAEYQRTFKRLCFDATVDPADIAALGGDATSGARWIDYREMVRRRLRGMSQVAFARTSDIVGRDAFLACFDRAMAAAPPRSPFIREAITQFGRYAEGDERLLGAADSAAAMLEFEICKWELGYLRADQPQVGEGGVVEFDFEGPPVLNPLFRVLELAYPSQLDGEAASEPHPTHLLIYRPRGVDEVRWWADDLFAARLFSALASGALSVTECIHQAAGAVGVPVDADLLGRLAPLLAVGVERGVLVGTRAD